MTIKKTLKSIILAGVLSLSIAGCDETYTKSKYNGMIGEDQVSFKSGYLIPSIRNILTVEKPDGRVIEYIDWIGGDLIVDHLKITKNDEIIKYNLHCEIGREVINYAQKQFDGYLKTIKDMKIKQEIENLK